MSGNRILVVDDEEDIQQLVSRILRDIGYQVDCAGDGAEAIERMTREPPDLLVLDLMMPGVDGWTVLERTRQMEAPPLVLLLTGSGDHDLVERATRQGASALMSKPFRFDELVATCHRLLETRSLPAPPGAPPRRAARRTLMAEITLLSIEGAPFFVGSLVNLSASGAQVELGVPLDKGATVRVAFRDAEAVTRPGLEGRVQWCSPAARGFAHGISFGALGSEQRRLLQGLLGRDAED